MKRLVVTILGMLTASIAFSQGKELSDLRTHLELSPDTPITLPNVPTLPAAPNLKVFLAVGLDLTLRNNLLEWIADWNKKDAKKYGAIQLVDNISDCDVVLARYILPDQVTVKSETHTRVQDQWVTDTNGTGKNVPVPVTSASSVSVVPVFEYVLRRDAQSYQILARRLATEPIESARKGWGSGTGRLAIEILFDLMKARK